MASRNDLIASPGLAFRWIPEKRKHCVKPQEPAVVAHETEQLEVRAAGDTFVVTLGVGRAIEAPGRKQRDRVSALPKGHPSGVLADGASVAEGASLVQSIAEPSVIERAHASTLLDVRVSVKEWSA